jgi:L-cysteine desulfidase
LLIDLRCAGVAGTLEIVIQCGHTNLVRLRKNGQELPREDAAAGFSPAAQTFEDRCYQPEHWPALVDDLAMDAELRQVVKQGIAYNMAAALHGQQYIHAEGNEMERLVMGAIFALMNGDPIPVMSCAGSGNKGLTCMIPVVS